MSLKPPLSLMLRGKTLGIMGGGQLGRMIAQAGKRLGCNIHVLCEHADDPATFLADRTTLFRTGDSIENIEPFVEDSDVFLCEFENIDRQVLNKLEQTGKLFPGADIIRISSSRILEKNLFESVHENTAPWLAVSSRDDLEQAYDGLMADSSLPSSSVTVLKSARMGYDGRGQVMIRRRQDIHDAWEKVGGERLGGEKLGGEKLKGGNLSEGSEDQQGSFILERFIPFQREISVIVVRSASGEIALLGPIWNVHQDHILRLSIHPDDGSACREITAKARQAACRIAEHLNLVGILTIEMFVWQDQVFLNEMAPRPHNSGHLTIEAGACSQFELFIRAVCNEALMVDTRSTHDAAHVIPIRPAVMINLLGGMIDRVPILKKDHDNHVHVYGKKSVREKRKMGHVTRVFPALGENSQDVDRQAMSAWVKDVTGQELKKFMAENRDGENQGRENRDGEGQNKESSAD